MFFPQYTCVAALLQRFYLLLLQFVNCCSEGKKGDSLHVGTISMLPVDKQISNSVTLRSPSFFVIISAEAKLESLTNYLINLFAQPNNLV